MNGPRSAFRGGAPVEPPVREGPAVLEVEHVGAGACLAGSLPLPRLKEDETLPEGAPVHGAVVRVHRVVRPAHLRTPSGESVALLVPRSVRRPNRGGGGLLRALPPGRRTRDPGFGNAIDERVPQDFGPPRLSEVDRAPGNGRALQGLGIGVSGLGESARVVLLEPGRLPGDGPPRPEPRAREGRPSSRGPCAFTLGKGSPRRVWARKPPTATDLPTADAARRIR